MSFRAPGEIELTKFPNETDSPESLIADLVNLRSDALRQNDFHYAIHLSHVIAWMNWLVTNYDELKEFQ